MEPIFVHELTLPGTSEFAHRFNLVSGAFARYSAAAGTPDENKLFADYFSMKFCLEQGLPIAEQPITY